MPTGTVGTTETNDQKVTLQTNKTLASMKESVAAVTTKKQKKSKKKKTKKNKKKNNSVSSTITASEQETTTMITETMASLSSPDEETRNKALASLTSLLDVRIQIKDDIYAILWKNIIECVKLSTVTNISQRVGSLVALVWEPNALTFMKAFWLVMGKKWSKFDGHRMDKMYALIRQFVHSSFKIVESDNWKLVQAYNVLISRLVSPNDEIYPDGIIYHLCDVYIDELSYFGISSNWQIPLAQLLDPFTIILANNSNKYLIAKTSDEIFKKMLNVIPKGEDSRYIRSELALVIEKMINIVKSNDTSTVSRNHAKAIAHSYLEVVSDVTEALADNSIEEAKLPPINMIAKQDNLAKAAKTGKDIDSDPSSTCVSGSSSRDVIDSPQPIPSFKHEDTVSLKENLLMTDSCFSIGNKPNIDDMKNKGKSSITNNSVGCLLNGLESSISQQIHHRELNDENCSLDKNKSNIHCIESHDGIAQLDNNCTIKIVSSPRSLSPSSSDSSSDEVFISPYTGYFSSCFSDVTNECIPDSADSSTLHMSDVMKIKATTDRSENTSAVSITENGPSKAINNRISGVHNSPRRARKRRISWGANSIREYVKGSAVPLNPISLPSSLRGVLKRKHDDEPSPSRKKNRRGKK